MWQKYINYGQSVIVICTTSYESHPFFHEFADWLTRA
jgi:hypothetical protein